MLKKTIKYIDHNENERTETFYFGLSQTEITIMDASAAGGMQNRLQKIIDDQDGAMVMSTLEEFILASYGEKTPDGRGFQKNAAIREAFKATSAYDILFMELVTNAEAAAEFIKGIAPKKPVQAPPRN